jgi:segregation and condensation protein A
LSFEVKLPLFEGPFDLLLFFIQRDELDIYDIPISKITLDFLDYLKHLKSMNMDLAGEFILVAASLMRIKSKMLLPRPELDEQGEEIDPREELVKHLLEYKRFKEVVEPLSEMEENRLLIEPRGNLQKELVKMYESNNVEVELQNIDLFKILQTFGKVMERYKIEQARPKHTVTPYPYTIPEQKDFLLGLMKGKKELSFLDVIKTNPERIAVIFNFLAILEMGQLQIIGIRIGEGLNNFWLVPAESSDKKEKVRSN